MDTDLSNDDLYSFVDKETTAFDVVASWESLCAMYRNLEFTDQLSDAVRLEEYKWIVKELNKFMTRARTKLMSCTSVDAMVKALNEMYTPTGKVSIENRKSLTYQKLRQQWVTGTKSRLEQLAQEMMEN